ncbi:MAG: hypothetical protein IPO98_00845 [Saprospiraceae bacterium]|nr:hypothetical protein [Saprospiraceae bacterium]
MRIYWVIVIFGLAVTWACTDTTDQDRITILNYLDERGLIATDTSGVFVVITSTGTSDRPEENSTIQLSYKGYYTDGVVFDQSPPDQKTTIKLSFALRD